LYNWRENLTDSAARPVTIHGAVDFSAPSLFVDRRFVGRPFSTRAALRTGAWQQQVDPSAEKRTIGNDIDKARGRHVRGKTSAGRGDRGDAAYGLPECEHRQRSDHDPLDDSERRLNH
jgi:hypothetical protein